MWIYHKCGSQISLETCGAQIRSNNMRENSEAASRFGKMLRENIRWNDYVCPTHWFLLLQCSLMLPFNIWVFQSHLPSHSRGIVAALHDQVMGGCHRVEEHSGWRMWMRSKEGKTQVEKEEDRRWCGRRQRCGYGGGGGCLVWLIVIWQLLERGELETCWLWCCYAGGVMVVLGWCDICSASHRNQPVCVSLLLHSSTFNSLLASVAPLPPSFLSSLHPHLVLWCSGCHCTFQCLCALQGLPLIWQCHRDPSSFSHSFHNLIFFLQYAISAPPPPPLFPLLRPRSPHGPRAACRCPHWAAWMIATAFPVQSI